MSLNDKFRIAILPLSIVDGDKSANISAVEQALNSIPQGTDLVVLPELFTTGYIGDVDASDRLAEPSDGPTIERVKLMAAAHKTAICGSFIAGEGDKVYNRAFFAEPQGEVTFYDKRHLFVLGEEAKIFTPGSKLPPVVRYRGWNLMMAICYDVRFPVWLRNKSNKYDALIVPANWPDKRGEAWTRLLQARAIENISYVVGANRSGSDEFGCYDGLSFAYDYFGNKISTDQSPFITATLDRTLLRQVREKFPAWKDADDFKITL